MVGPQPNPFPPPLAKSPLGASAPSPLPVAARMPAGAVTAALTASTAASVSARRRLILRPLARVERISLFEREVRERLSRAALELIFGAAGIMSEGQRSARNGREIFFGSTMLTIELPAVAGSVRDVCDARAAQHLCALLATDGVAATRIKSIAAAEAERLCRARPRTVGTEIKVRARGTTVYVDVDVEASF
jgi:hypothetical protein